ncbi:MAG: hypothetical protein IPJ24_17905 [bacterium]|nr:hypothetical protein [bacterium]
MKLGELTSFGHNLADSLASGMCFMAGIFRVDVFGEASASSEGYIVVDFLRGETEGGTASASLKSAIRRFSELVPSLAEQHRIAVDQVKTIQARFSVDPVMGPHFTVTVETLDGRRSIDQYAGIPGKRYSRSRRSRDLA